MTRHEFSGRASYGCVKLRESPVNALRVIRLPHRTKDARQAKQSSGSHSRIRDGETLVPGGRVGRLPLLEFELLARGEDIGWGLGLSCRLGIVQQTAGR